MWRRYLLFFGILIVGHQVSRAEPINPSQKQVILFLGDSLTAGYGVTREEAYPYILEKKSKELGKNIKVINGAESGSLSSNLKSRLQFYAKREKIDVVVIASGGNDARQLSDIQNIKTHLTKTIQLAKELGIKPVLIQMKVFPNLGKQYVKDFTLLYPTLAKQEKIILWPFLLEGIAGNREYNISDGFHPNPIGHQKISENLWPHFKEL